ncbi:hypothetical protein MOQ72_21585 [Saccharopolyspora sp. K220]|uniref:hypothetical protein n=1 Tax=Saccharopolyspora soli TaxID=2926618 RepID=UPI001F56033F|nr:hypothetical protein [Saccharopolyspora soli]MCI2420041.1 hypothetical protein [Saccharopolyspora soli]
MAGIAYVKLQCHQETWRALVDGVVAVDQLPSRDAAVYCDGVNAQMVEVELSGIKLMSILRITASDRIIESFKPGSANAVSIAIRLRKEIVRILAKISPAESLRERVELPPIVLDDR